VSARAEELAAKYDRLAASYSARYRDPGAIASRQVGLALNWGAAPRPGGRILELGCSDGFVTAELVRAGFAVTGVDLSPGMIAVARARLQREGLVADLRVAGAERFEPDGTYDVAIALMWTFFAYVAEPAPVLRRLAGATRKLILDVNPRQMPLRVAMDQVRTAGFSDVSWRPFLLPQRVRLPGPVRALLELGERVPGLRALPLRWKFSAVVKGER
jgi:SAM-dependent methyltransferase